MQLVITDVLKYAISNNRLNRYLIEYAIDNIRCTKYVMKDAINKKYVIKIE